MTHYSCFLLENEKKALKFVLKGFSGNSEIPLIEKPVNIDDLQNWTVTHIYWGNKEIVYFFLIQKPRQQTEPDVLFQITEIMGRHIQIEKYRVEKDQFNATAARGIFTQRQSAITYRNVLRVQALTRQLSLTKNM